MASEDGESASSSLFEGMILFQPSSDIPSSSDIFSDLILQITPPPQPPRELELEINVTSLPPTRQTSRKKKRAVRIGYGRDAAAGEEPSAPSSIPDPSSLPTPSEEEPLPPPLMPSPVVSWSTSEEDKDDPVKQHVVEETLVNPPPPPPPPPPEAEEMQEDSSASAEEMQEDSPASAEGKMDAIRAQISKKLHHIREMAASLSADRKQLRRSCRKAAENVNSASTRYKDLERKLEEACEAEDFERAERVSESLVTAEKEKDERLRALRAAEANCDAVDLKMQEVMQMQIAAEEEGAFLLQQFAMGAVDSADRILKNAEEISKKEMEEWQLSTEALEIKKLEAGIESYLINEARSGFENSIDCLIEDDKKEKELLSRKRDALAKELQDLLALVKVKEAQIIENDSQIQEVDKRISDVVSNFQEARSNIDIKYNDMQSTLSRIESQCESLFLRKKEIDQYLTLAERNKSKLKELAHVSADTAKTYHDLVELRKSSALSILKSREDKVRLANTEEKISEDIQILRQQTSAARSSLQELSSTRAAIQQEVSSFNQRISFIEKRGPELEAEKKVAAAARNFKEAGRIAAEAKALSMERETIQNKRQAATVDLKKVEEEIENTVDKIQENEGLVLSKEREAAMAGCERLYIVAAAARAERSAALELGDLEEGDILAQEAEAAECKARELQQAYDLKKPFETSQHLNSIELVTNLACR